MTYKTNEKGNLKHNNLLTFVRTLGYIIDNNLIAKKGGDEYENVIRKNCCSRIS